VKAFGSIYNLGFNRLLTYFFITQAFLSPSALYAANNSDSGRKPNTFVFGKVYLDSSAIPQVRTEKLPQGNLSLFPDDMARRIIHPQTNKNEPLLQNPVVPTSAIEGVLAELDSSKDFEKQLIEKYGISRYTNSYDPADPNTFGSRHDFRLGVSPNCFLCHSTMVGNKWLPGAGNTRLDLREFFKDLVFTDVAGNVSSIPAVYNNLISVYEDIGSENENPLTSLSKSLVRTRMIVSLFGFVLDPRLQSISAGHSNPWSFAKNLFNWRDDDMNYLDRSLSGRGLKAEEQVLDPMPWWNLKYKVYINWDGIIKKSPRAIVQAVLSPGRSGAQIRAMDPDYEKLLEAAEAMEAPRFPYVSELDIQKVSVGESIFNQNCATCHGVYSENLQYKRDPVEFRKTYTNRIVSQSVIGTDPQRAKSIDLSYLSQLQNSWIGYYGKEDQFKSRFDKMGYQVPPLWGLWASAPYFHNGSVPTLKAVLFPELRPAMWKLKPVDFNGELTAYDYQSIGLSVESRGLEREAKSTKVYDTTKNDGRSNAGHERQFNELSIKERLKLFEYLKTL